MVIISVDFDGIIVEDGYWPETGPALPGAVEVINALHNMGFCIIINSCRVGVAEMNMIRWLKEYNVDFCHVGVNCRKLIEKYGADCRKISANVMIDDKSIYFDRETFSWKDVGITIIEKYGFVERDCNVC